MKARKILCAILALMLAATLLVSCDPADSNSGEASGTSADASASESTPADTKAKAEYPEGTNYGGEKFVVLTTYTTTTVTNPDFGGYDDEEYASDTINDAIFNRNAAVEEALGIDIDEMSIYDDGSTNPMYDAIMTDVNADKGAYDLVRPRLIFCAALAADGYLQDLKSLEYLHGLEEDWWFGFCNDACTIGDQQFFAVGDISWRALGSASCIVFNKDMLAANGLENPYELVKEKKWTMDKLLEWSTLVRNDLNSDGKITYEDEYGVGGQKDLIWSLFYAAGQRLASKNAEGIPEITAYNENSVNAIEKILQLMQNKDYYVSANDYFAVAQWPGVLLQDAFVAGRNLLYTMTLGGVSALREMKVDFGILPNPLFDENQENYETYMHTYGTHGTCITKVLDDDRTERASIVMEVLGAESKNITTAAFTEKSLKYQQTRDDDSQEMIDIIYATVGCDIGHIFEWGRLNFSLLHAVLDSSASNFRSIYETNATSAETDLKNDMEALIENN